MKKQFIFLDNDHFDRAEQDCHRAFRTMDQFADLPYEYVNQAKIVCDFHRLERKEKMDILFDHENVLVTWSMYTRTHFNSLGQLEHFLSRAAMNDITDIIYFDTSGNLYKDLEITEDKRAFSILTAFETNYIISFDYNADEGKQCFRLRIDLTKGVYKPPFRREYISIPELLEIK